MGEGGKSDAVRFMCVYVRVPGIKYIPDTLCCVNVCQHLTNAYIVGPLLAKRCLLLGYTTTFVLNLNTILSLVFYNICTTTVWGYNLPLVVFLKILLSLTLKLKANVTSNILPAISLVSSGSTTIPISGIGHRGMTS